MIAQNKEALTRSTKSIAWGILQSLRDIECSCPTCISNALMDIIIREADPNVKTELMITHRMILT